MNFASELAGYEVTRLRFLLVRVGFRATVAVEVATEALFCAGGEIPPGFYCIAWQLFHSPIEQYKNFRSELNTIWLNWFVAGWCHHQVTWQKLTLSLRALFSLRRVTTSSLMTVNSSFFFMRHLRADFLFCISLHPKRYEVNKLKNFDLNLISHLRSTFLTGYEVEDVIWNLPSLTPAFGICSILILIDRIVIIILTSGIDICCQILNNNSTLYGHKMYNGLKIKKLPDINFMRCKCNCKKKYYL